MKVKKGGILGFHLLQQGNTQSDPKSPVRLFSGL